MKPIDCIRCFSIVNVLAVCLAVDAVEPPVANSQQDAVAAPPTSHCCDVDKACCKDGKDKNEKDAKCDCCKTSALETNSLLNFDPFTAWLPATQREKLDCLQVGFTDQNGQKGQLADFGGRPMVISFFYSRCENRLKCPATVSKFAELQQLLQSEGLSEGVTQLMVSFEPQYDTPGRLSSYAKSHGMKCNDHCRMLQLDEESMPQVVQNLDVPVNYNSGWVNIHGVALYLVDHQGRLARKYHTLLWDNQAVLADLTKLVKEN